jgi:hypothetical protein
MVCVSRLYFAGRQFTRRRVLLMPNVQNDWLSGAVDLPAKAELLAFFCQNQYAMDDAQGLAGWLGLDAERVLQAAEVLTLAHVLTKYGEGEDAIFAFNHSDETVKKAVEDFICTKYLPLEQRFHTLNELLQGRTPLHD